MYTFQILTYVVFLKYNQLIPTQLITGLQDNMFKKT